MPSVCQLSRCFTFLWPIGVLLPLPLWSLLLPFLFSELVPVVRKKKSHIFAKSSEVNVHRIFAFLKHQDNRWNVCFEANSGIYTKTTGLRPVRVSVMEIICFLHGLQSGDGLCDLTWTASVGRWFHTLPKEGSQLASVCELWSKLAPTLFGGSFLSFSCSSGKRQMRSVTHDLSGLMEMINKDGTNCW